MPADPLSDGNALFAKYTTLAAARSLGKHARIVLEADFGGQVLLSFPVSLIACSDESLLTLSCDLVSITWGGGGLDDGSIRHNYGSDGEGMYIFLGRTGEGIPGGMGGGAAAPDLWLHDELEYELQLREQILSVLLGHQPRLDVPEHFPDCDLPSLEIVRRYPYSRVLIVSGSDNRVLVNCAASIVHADEARLIQLGRELDAIREESNVLPVANDPRIIYRPRQSSGSERVDKNELWLRPGPVHRRRDDVLAVLTGKRATL